MKPTKFNYISATTVLMNMVCTALKKKMTLHNFSKLLRNKLESYVVLTRHEKTILFNTYYDLMRRMKAQGTEPRWQKQLGSRAIYDKLITTAHKIQADVILRKKRFQTKTDLANPNTIFFLCSDHHDCAEDHLPYQGKIYVDRHWRQKVDGNAYKKVMAYIKNHSTMTIQDVISAPIYMTTRPYCRHYFMAMDTKQVLSSSTNKLLKENKMIKNSRQGSTADRYYKTRKKIYTYLNSKTPNKYFEHMIGLV